MFTSHPTSDPTNEPCESAVQLPQYLRFWGKAKPATEADILCHPAAYHMLDVAAVFEIIFEHYRLTWIPTELKSLLIFLTAIHDIGKITQSFQYQAADYWATDILGPIPSTRPGTTRHDSLGFQILTEKNGLVNFQNEFKKLSTGKMRFPTQWKTLIRATSGHHGTPPIEGMYPNINDFCNTCAYNAKHLFDDLKTLLVSSPISCDLSEKLCHEMSWWFSGMVNLADWIGSSSWFKYTDPKYNLKDYWEKVARPTAKSACDHAGIIPAKSGGAKTFTQMFGISTPFPLQHWCDTFPLPSGPKLLLLEDEPGNGKTEGALIAAYRMICNSDGKGLFFGLPTRATANSMFERVENYIEKFFLSKERPSLALMTGKSKLSERFRKIIVDFSIEDTELSDEETTSAECAAWLAADNRRAFLADIGVGTIDQALLAVMPSKFSMLRLLGLSQKILIVDEAHAYDTYMLELLKALLEMHARFGGSAIILSATLPMATKNGLADAFRKGLSKGLKFDFQPLTNQDYPLASLVSENTILEKSFAGLNGPSRGKKSANVVIIDDFDIVFKKIDIAVNAGACVGWVRNTVRDAIETYKFLKTKYGDKVVLFHSRFVVGDRADIEQNVKNIIGKHSDRPERDGKIIVATQVIEQSLDIDFDLMISDPAPIDLLIQRVGRLWRHIRSNRPLIIPDFIICGPLPVNDPTANWISGTFSNNEFSVEMSRFVYGDIALLWRSLKILEAIGHISEVSTIRPMIEQAYSEFEFKNAFPNNDFIPPELQKATDRATSENNRKECWGFDASLIKNISEGYCDRIWNREQWLRTRVGPPNVTLRLAKYVNGRLEPYYPHGIMFAGKWALSEVTSNVMAISNIKYNDHIIQKIVDTEKNSWKKFDKFIQLVVLQDRGNGSWVSKIVGKDNNDNDADYGICYNSTIGLEVSKGDCPEYDDD